MPSQVRIPVSRSDDSPTPRRPESESFSPEFPTRLTSPRRSFLSRLLAGTSLWVLGGGARTVRKAGVSTSASDHDEGIFAYIARLKGRFDPALYRQLLGAANEFKEGDQAIGVAAPDEQSRARARALLANTRVGDLIARPVFEDSVSSYIDTVVDREITRTVAGWTLAGLKRFLLRKEEAAIKGIMPGLPSDIIGCVVKLMSNDELIAVGRKVFNPLPHSKLGAKGYMGARIQPNSPTDNVDDIRWQVFDGWSYAVGDVVLGTNPVSSEVASVASIQSALAEILEVFGLEDALPHCVLSHVDVQAEVERQDPGSTAIWFQSLGGVADANTTFGLSVEKMVSHAERRTGKYGFYFETGQGADATNGHGKGFDMVLHEARKYGFARALVHEVAKAQRSAGRTPAPWLHLNDVAGFIGPEIFRTREQLVRCCLEDTVMGKLHGLPIGLDICSTLHMDIDLDDLNWCIERVMPANPAYLMALPTKNDPMLSYLTTGFLDHVRVREKFGFKVNDVMWRFFQSLKVIDAEGRPTEHFGQPTWVYLQYLRAKGDQRPDREILAEGRRRIAEVRERGVFIAEGHGKNTWDLEPRLRQRIRYLYQDSKKCIRAELPEDFDTRLPSAIMVRSRSRDRNDYILHPPTGEELDAASASAIRRLAKARGDRYDVQLVISDGLNVYSLTDDGHLNPYLAALRTGLEDAGHEPAPEQIVVRNGRVRAGYRIGEMLFGNLRETGRRRAILHVIGERPGSGHHAFSVYMTRSPVRTWARAGVTDHNITKVVSGIADTALDPVTAAADTVRILSHMA
ncbi:MAG: ethanolamine ammonia-lyase subunit EutB [Candidatus Aminicenantes bacterium]|nr:ethanolamine ammonia-lyase subunit EutB [Candidatus Aminicenantes bacterium]